MKLPFVVLALCASLLTACTDRATQQRLNQQDERINELEKRVDELQKQVDQQQHADPLGGALQSLLPLLAPMPAVPSMPSTTTPSTMTARCKADGKGYVVDKADFGAAAGDLTQVTTDVRIVPYFVGGQAQGFKVYSIRPDSLVASCGLMNGDVVSSVNGMPLNTPDKALEVYSNVTHGDHADIQVLRQGAPLMIHIRLR